MSGQLRLNGGNEIPLPVPERCKDEQCSLPLHQGIYKTDSLILAFWLDDIAMTLWVDDSPSGLT